ncbi:survival protein SurE-like phosphatase/nucleotidase [Tanacetum coccineum]
MRLESTTSSCESYCYLASSYRSAKLTEISGTTAFAISGTHCTSLGISKALFPGEPDLVLSGINLGGNCGYHIVYSGTVAVAREAFIHDFPSVSISYRWVKGTSNINDFKLAAEACLPLISAIFVDIKNKTYPRKCFLNVDFPTDVLNHKGFKLTKQGSSSIQVGWKQVIADDKAVSQEHRLFTREITVTPLGALTNADIDTHGYFEGWLPGAANCTAAV